jgi:hypothetical protein
MVFAGRSCMFRCRIQVAMLLVLALPMQAFAGSRCCQSGHGTCCSGSVDLSTTQASSCCTQSRTTAQPGRCKHCAAAEENAQSNLSSADHCNCHCKQDSKEPAAIKHRRHLSLDSFLVRRDSPSVVVRPSAPALLKFEYIERSPGIRLHAIYCVWLN